MISSASLISLGGVVLWSCSFGDDANAAAALSSISRLIQGPILEERCAENHFVLDGTHFRWKVVHAIKAVFYIEYQGVHNVNHLINMLDLCADKYEELVRNKRGNLVGINWVQEEPPRGFDDYFLQLLVEKPQQQEYQDVTKGGKSVKASKTKIGKQKREWDYRDNVSKKDIDALDFSDEIPQEEQQLVKNEQETESALANMAQMFKTKFGDLMQKFKKPPQLCGDFYNSFSTMVLKYAGNLELTREVMEAPLQELRYHLASKNVGNDVCAVICDSVASRLVRKRTESLKSVRTTLSESVKDAVRRILTPKEPIDILHAIEESRANGQLYSIAFVGVNGVGKSSSLAKICWMLRNNGIKVLIVACDTFRSGAIEQLKTHANRLDVELFDRGYGKDPAGVAKEGLAYAATQGYNVVLIDTAGRMQDNEGLMAALAKLVQVNRPNLVLFVGEALVGNDAIDQLTKFNKHIERSTSRKIDGIILTKFDTVDDKVGAALTMAHTIGKPIVYVGTGQGYPHLAKLDVDNVTAALFR
ncbi:bifunctional Signal recognition particle [Babesia duncani]|uniref:Bifunctional Signal recognition particle n=1 Tax=Babesia duncani TaxID=323732 RepID=A0AAD9UP76_9APIC|nr:bifunctional Signal recognition particle [Babesia duncani]